MKSEWIPCKERLPKEKGDYIVAWLPKDRKILLNDKKCFIEFCSFNGEKWCDDIPQSGKKGFDVLAWMPLPELYRWE